MKKSKTIRIITHIVTIMVILLFPYLLEMRSFADFKRLFLNANAFRYFISFGLFIIFVYLNYYWLVEAYYFKRQFLKYALSILFALGVILYLPELIAFGFNIKEDRPEQFDDKGFKPQKPKPKDGIFDVLFRPPPPRDDNRGRSHDELPVSPKLNIIVFFFISIFISITLLTDKRLQQIENEKLTIELVQLKAQINPHFLFNTLNGIYALVIKNDKNAGDSVLKLSGLMRYILTETPSEQVPLSEEIGFINNYISLQRHRLTEYMSLNYSFEGDTSGKTIAPLLLITFIENAFKHGINPDEDCLININIGIEAHNLTLKVSNKKVPLSPNQLSSGIGLANVKERLNLLYPAKHGLKIKETDDTYFVELTLNLI